MTMPTSWMDGYGVRLILDSRGGPLYIRSLNMIPMVADAHGAEIVRYLWDRVDPETGEHLQGAGRLVYEPLPDPRAEVQPAPPADATSPFGSAPGGFLAAFRDVANRTADVNPAGNPITPQEHAQGAHWVERPSGPPVRIVDGPADMPVVVPEPARPDCACASPDCPTPDGQYRHGNPPPAPAPNGRCPKCRRPFGPADDSTSDTVIKDATTPFCKDCVYRCHDTEIADHWCPVDQWRTDNRKAPEDQP